MNSKFERINNVRSLEFSLQKFHSTSTFNRERINKKRESPFKSHVKTQMFCWHDSYAPQRVRTEPCPSQDLYCTTAKA